MLELAPAAVVAWKSKRLAGVRWCMVVRLSGGSGSLVGEVTDGTCCVLDRRRPVR